MGERPQHIPKDLLYILKYSFTITLSFMFIFITIFNLMTLVQSSEITDVQTMLLYASIFNNIIGIASLVPVYLYQKKSWLFISIWFCFYIGFLLLNILYGWVVNATGYLMLFFGIALILTLRKE